MLPGTTGSPGSCVASVVEPVADTGAPTSGDPNGPDLSRWSPYDRAIDCYLKLGAPEII